MVLHEGLCKKGLWRPSFCSLNSALMQTHAQTREWNLSAYMWAYKKVLRWGVRSTQVRTWIGRKEGSRLWMLLPRAGTGFCFFSQRFCLLPLLLEENTLLTLAPCEGGLFKTLVLVENEHSPFQGFTETHADEDIMAWDSFGGTFTLKMEISGAQWKKKIKRWHLFTWHMVPGLEGVCGGVDRTVYGALGHLGSSPHTTIQSRRQPVCCFNCPRTQWPISELNG